MDPEDLVRQIKHAPPFTLSPHPPPYWGQEFDTIVPNITGHRMNQGRSP